MHSNEAWNVQVRLGRRRLLGNDVAVSEWLTYLNVECTHVTIVQK